MLKHVLLIDDDSDLTFLAKIFLEKKDLIVEISNTGELGLEILNELHNQIDLIILDHSFRNSTLQGLEIFQKIQEITTDIPVVISSGYNRDYFKSKYSNDVFIKISGFIGKNYSDANFVDTLHDFYNTFNKQ